MTSIPQRAPSPFERVPPHDLEAEIALLGSVLVEPLTMARVRFVTTDDFYSARHRAVWSAMLALDAAGKPPDPILVRDELQRRDSASLPATDVVERLAELVTATCSPGNAPHYGILIRRSADTRRMLAAAAELQQACYAQDGEPLDLQRAALQSITDAVRVSTASAFPWASMEEDDEIHEEPDWLWNRYIARERITLLSGHGGSGKSTLYYGILQAMLRGRAFLGAKTSMSPAVVLTEESPTDWRPRAKRFELTGCAWLDRRALHPRQSLEAYCDEAYRKAMTIGAYLIVIDSLSKWFGFGKDEEKDAGAMEAALRPLEALTTRGMAILLVHHFRKSDGEEGTGVRGSGALLGAVETSLELRRFPMGRGADREELRCLTVAKSRYPDPPPDVVYHHDASGAASCAFTVKGDPTSARRNAAAQRVVGYVEAAPDWVDSGTIRDALGAQEKAVRSALADAYAEGLLERRGEGRRGDPYLYRARRS